MIKEHEQTYSFHKDWFTFVFQVPMATLLDCYQLAGRNSDDIDLFVNFCLSLLQLDDAEWQENGHGIYTYSRSKVITGENSIIVGFNDKIYPDLDDADKNTVMVQMSGAGYDFWLTYLEDKGYSYKDIEKQLFENRIVRMTPSRIDATLDLFNFPKEFSPYYVHEVTYRGDYLGRSNPTWMFSYDRKGGIKDDSKYSTAKEGHTLYFGRTGKKQLRIYNKLSERVGKVGKLYTYKSWYRWEFELHDQAARDWWNYYMEHDQSEEDAWRFWLSTNYRWVITQGQKKQAKKSRYPSTWWYKQLVGKFENAKPIRHERRIATYERSYHYVNDQVFNVMFKMMSYKIKKYQMNGVDYDDAVKMAFDNVFLNFKKRLKQEGIDYKAVANYFKGEDEDEIAKLMERKAQAQIEHRDGV